MISMTGRLGTPVDERTTRNGTPYVTFRMANTSRYLRDGTWTDGPTTWVTVRCYRGLAEHVCFSLQKGQPVLVIGRLRTESWQDPSGAQRERTVLEAQSVGHDLNWGASSFRRMQKEQPPAERDDPPQDEFGEQRSPKPPGETSQPGDVSRPDDSAHRENPSTAERAA